MHRRVFGRMHCIFSSVYIITYRREIIFYSLVWFKFFSACTCVNFLFEEREKGNTFHTPLVSSLVSRRALCRAKGPLFVCSAE